MQEIRRKRATVIGLRASVPKIARVLALMVMVAGIVYVGISYYKRRDNKDFRLRMGPAELSKEVVGVVENYERRITEGDRLKLFLRAARDTTFSDGHHELTDVHLEVYPEKGDRPDKISARSSVYFPESTEVTFAGNVLIDTRDRLTAKTEAIKYNQTTEVATTTVPIEFARDNVHGRSDAATILAKEKKLELNGGVEITVQPENKSNDPQFKSSARGRPVVIRSARANFDQATLQLIFSGGATAEQERDIMSGETLTATLNEQKRLRLIEARTNSYLRTMDAGRAAEIHAVNMDFFFDGDQQLQRAAAALDIRARTLDADAEMQLTTTAAGHLNVEFMAQAERSLLKEMRADGRPVVTLAAPKSKAGDPRAANKRLTADEVKLFWRATGRDLERAEAAGNAELFVEPVQATAQSDRKTLTAPRFDCEFFESGNLARIFNATGGSKAVIEPVQPSEKRGTRTITSQKMAALFTRATQDVERLDAQGDTKFNERDRNGQAANASYTAADGVVRLREGEPVVWDSRARMKAVEIDSDSVNQVSYGRGKSTTTYYSQEQTGGATPFAKVKSPVFIVADTAELQHQTGLGIYTGNARAWQDDNFVSADKITLRHETRRMEAVGNVKSALYQARRKDASGNRSVVPVFATSQRMFYSDPDRLLHYENDVDIKQGTERITSEVADVYLQKETYEAERTVAQRNVVLRQPGRLGKGDWAQYTAADETMVLTGAPAHVEDDVQGTSESRRLTVYLRENRVVSDGGDSKQNTGRVRSTHKVKKS